MMRDTWMGDIKKETRCSETTWRDDGGTIRWEARWREKDPEDQIKAWWTKWWGTKTLYLPASRDSTQELSVVGDAGMMGESMMGHKMTRYKVMRDKTKGLWETRWNDDNGKECWATKEWETSWGETRWKDNGGQYEGRQNDGSQDKGRQDGGRKAEERQDERMIGDKVTKTRWRDDGWSAAVH